MFHWLIGMPDATATPSLQPPRRQPSPPRGVTHQLAVVLSLLCLVFGPVRSLHGEGTQTGILQGTVVDSAQQPLPDVPVQLFGAQLQRSTVTDAAGRFRFQGLAIGSYRVTADLLGLSAYRDDVRVFIDKTTDTSLVLSENSEPDADLPVEEDLIQVLALAPLIDRYETRISSSVRREFLDELPLARVYQSVALLLPSVVGGADGNPNVSGALRGSNLYLVDGVDTTDPTTGLFGLNLSYDAIQEVDVTTAAPQVEYGRASGAIINVVTRSGDATFRGSARWLSSSNGWNSDYRDQGQGLDTEIAAANAGDDNLDSTLAATLGGPLWGDRLGFFATFEQADSSFLRPSFEGTSWDQDTSIQATGIKLTGHGQRHSLLAQYTADSADFNTFASFDRRPGENRAVDIPDELRGEVYDPLPGDIFALQHRVQEGDFVKLQWYTVVNADVSLTAAVATQDRRLERHPLNQRSGLGGAVHEGAVPYGISANNPDGEPQAFTTWNGLTDRGSEERRRQQANVTADYFLQRGGFSHGLRFGVDLQRTESTQDLRFSGQDGIDQATGLPVSGQLFSDLDNRPQCTIFGQSCIDFDADSGTFQPFLLFNFYQRPTGGTEAENLALFVNDAISFGRWLVSVGMRYEQVSGDDERGRKLVDDDSLAPRIGFKYDPKGDGKAFLSLTYSRFTEPFPQLYLDDFTQAEPLSGYSSYLWRGVNGDPDCLLAEPTDINSPCWQFTGSKPLESLSKAEPNLDLERSSVEELVVAFERQLTDNTSLRLSWIQRDWQDLWDDVLLLDGSSPLFDPVVGSVENLPQAERTYRSVQLLLQRRYAERWQMLASYTWSETEGNLFQSTGRSSFQDLVDFDDTNIVQRFGPAPYDRSHQLKVFANYQIPIGTNRLSLGGVMRYETGTPYQRETLIDNVGTRFDTPRGSLRLDDFWQLDLSASYDFDFQRENLGLEFKLEAFNLSDEQSVLEVETLTNGGGFGQPRSIADVQAPRNFRLTVGVRF